MRRIDGMPSEVGIARESRASTRYLISGAVSRFPVGTEGTVTGRVNVVAILHIDKELLEAVHRGNERIPVSVLQEGMRYLVEFLMEVVT